MDQGDEAYILLLLSDGNLPTGSFVASSGFESFITHGFFTAASAPSIVPKDKLEAVVDFVRDSLTAYAHSALPFVSDSHKAVTEWWVAEGDGEIEIDRVLEHLIALDELYDVMTLNHVARRASKSQGVALLTLHSKGFSKPPFLVSTSLDPQMVGAEGYNSLIYEAHLAKIVDRLKLTVRQEKTHGHLPVCWGLLTAALNLSLERSQYLHLFLHARSLLSAAVRMNTLGPYGAQQILLHAVRPVVEAQLAQCGCLRTGLTYNNPTASNSTTRAGEVAVDMPLDGPAMTWPLGEILASRHDLLHSRIFNS